MERKKQSGHYLQMIWYFIQKTLKSPPKTCYIYWKISARLHDSRLIYRNLAFYTVIMSYQKEKVKKKKLFKMTSVRIKYLRINLTEEVKHLCSENHKTLMKETEEIQRNGKMSCVIGSEGLILLKWPYYPKQSTNLMQSLSKYPWHFSQN